MKKTSKMFLGLALAGMLLTGCNFQGPNSATNSQAGAYDKQQIFQMYKAAGGELSYDEWLESVKGADGASLLAGANNPSDTDGKNGDVFVNYGTWDIFVKVGGAWQSVGNIKGPAGEKGQDGADGKDGKDGQDGKDGKDGKDGTDGKDGQDGKDGKDGTSFLTVNGAPAADFGKNGDTYLDLDSFDLYTKANGEWTLAANLGGGNTQEKGDPTFFLENGFTEIKGWPTAHVDVVMGEGVIPGFNMDGTFYEKYGVSSDSMGEYDYELLATYGDYTEVLASQLEAANFEYDYDNERYYDENEDRLVYVVIKDGFTYARFFGPYRKPADAGDIADVDQAIIDLFDTIDVEVQVAEYPAESANAYFIDDETDFYIYGSDYFEMCAFVDAMTGLDWEAEEDEYGDFDLYLDNGASLYVGDYTNYYGYIVIRANYSQPFEDTWPAEAIAKFMAANDFTDELPVYAEEGAEFSAEEDEDGLYILVDSADPDEAVETYCDALDDAEFEYGEDSYGYPVYTSPNNQYVVEPYVSMGGYFVIFVH